MYARRPARSRPQGGGPPMWLPRLLLILTIAALLTSIPCPANRAAGLGWAMPAGSARRVPSSCRRISGCHRHSGFLAASFGIRSSLWAHREARAPLGRTLRRGARDPPGSSRVDAVNQVNDQRERWPSVRIAVHSPVGFPSRPAAAHPGNPKTQIHCDALLVSQSRTLGGRVRKGDPRCRLRSASWRT